MKKFRTLIWFIMLVISLTITLSFSISAYSYSGKCGENLTWELDTSTGVLTISGKGDMTIYGISPPWNSHREKIVKVVFPDTLTSIGNYAFYDCQNLQSAIIPESVTTIGEFAFAYCYSLTAINIPKNLEIISDFSFAYCKSLTNIEIPSRVTTIGDSAFKECYLLSNVSIPYGVTVIDDYAFSYCHSFTDISIPKTVTTIGFNVFRRCENIETITIFSSDCDIAADSDTLGYRTTSAPIIRSAKGSTAYAHAVKYKYAFEAIADCDSGNHYPINHSPIREPSCTYPGLETSNCGFCDAPFSKEIPPLGHKLTSTTITEPTCTENGISTNYCEVCGVSFTEEIESFGHEYEPFIVQPSCTENGSATYTCNKCGDSYIQTIPSLGHTWVYHSSTLLDHIDSCSRCGETKAILHSYIDNTCACGTSVSIDESIRFYHTLNLSSDIAITFAIPAVDLQDYDEFVLQCDLPQFYNNKQIGYTRTHIYPALNGSYYYFTLTGIAAINMNDNVEAILYMKKDSNNYCSKIDVYSVASYAYSQLGKNNISRSLKELCANLLRYGSNAQLYKSYRTDALVDDRMNAEQRSYLSDLQTISFGSNNYQISDVESPVIKWVGKSLSLDTRIELNYIFDASLYKGNIGDLTLRLSYENVYGTHISLELTNPEAYATMDNMYVFRFNGLLASELRALISAAVYDNGKQLSNTVVYSIDTYGHGKSGVLGTLCSSLMAYSDSAKTYFSQS